MQDATNVKWFGAKGDGINDDTLAIQAAINSTYNKYLASLNSPGQPTANNVIYMPGGTYMVSSPINVRTNMKLVGTSNAPYNPTSADYATLENIRSGTTIKATSDFTGAQENLAVLDLAADNVFIENLTVDGDNLGVRTWWSDIVVTTAQGKTISKQARIPVNTEANNLSIYNDFIAPFYMGEGVQYFQLQVNGGSGNYTWSITSGTLPTGLTLSSNGLVSGTPTEYATNFVEFQVSDGSRTVRKTLAVNIPTPFIVDNTIYNATEGEVIVPYTLTARSITTPAPTWTMKYAPSGVVISSTGVISGTVAARPGTYYALAELSYNGIVTDSRTYEVDVVGTNAGIRITNTGDRPSYTQNSTAPDFQFRASGGGGVYTWTIDTSQQFPSGFENTQSGYPTATSPGPGLTLSSTGVLSGTPIATGKYNFFVRATSTTNVNNFFSSLVIINVASPGVRPRIQAINVPTADPGTAYSDASIIVEDIPAAQPYAYSAKHLPSGLSIDASTGVITGTPTLNIPRVNGCNFRWASQVRNCTFRGFRNGAGIFVYGPSNLHRVHSVVIAECDIGIDLNTQVYDSHWEDGYLHSCRVGMRFGSGAAAHNILDYRIEYIFEHGVDMSFANENAFTSCYWDTCGWTSITASGCKNLNIVGNRFYRSGRLLRGYGNHLNTNAPPIKSSHLSFATCDSVTVTGNTFQIGSSASGDSSILGANLKRDLDAFIRPITCIYFGFCQGLVVVGNNIQCPGTPPIIYAGGAYDTVVIRDNNFKSPTPLIANTFGSRQTLDTILPNGDLAGWINNTTLTVTPISSGSALIDIAYYWNLDRSSAVNINTNFQKREVDKAEQKVPCRYYLHFDKPANTGSSPGTFQYFQLSCTTINNIWELSGRDAIVSFYAKSPNANKLFSRIQVYPATTENSLALLTAGGNTYNLSPLWERYFYRLTLPDLRDLNVGKDGNPNLNVNFIFDDGGVAYDVDITGVRLETADNIFIPSPFKPSSNYELGSSVVPITNGGTGSATQNLVDLTTDQVVAGVKTLTSQLIARNTLATTQISTAQLRLESPNSSTGFLAQDNASISYLDINPSVVANTNSAFVRLFRTTNTTGSSGLQILQADNTGSITHFLSANTNSYLSTNTTRLGIGTFSPGAKVQITGGLVVSNLASAATDPGSGNLSVSGSASIGNFITTGGFVSKWRVISASTTLLLDDYYVGASASAGSITLTLPTIATAGAGRVYVIFKTDSSANAVNIAAATGEILQGSSTPPQQIITTQRGMIKVVCTGGSWYIEALR